MTNIWVYSLISVIFVSLASLIGLLTLSIRAEKIKKFLMYAVSFSAGAMLGDAFIHLLPEVIKEKGFGLNISIYILLGIAISFFVEKIIRWRHCHHNVAEEVDNIVDHHHDHKPEPFAVMNLVGDAVHNFIDGIIIGASYLASIEVGLATTIAVLLHEIPQEISDFAVLLQGGYKKRKALLFNFLTSLTAVGGALIALVAANLVENLTTFLIPFAAGGFIYIAGSDLIPELHKESNATKSVLQLIFFVLGIFVMGLLLLF